MDDHVNRIIISFLCPVVCCDPLVQLWQNSYRPPVITLLFNNSTIIPLLEVLDYSIYSSSGHSASYGPENIRHNQSTDQASRWSSAANDQNQFILLKLDKMALLESIGFGKFHKGTGKDLLVN